ncbi:MAG: hypothetical protein M3Q51_03470 [Pseudomonadota bacterium]|nr:hypothetical protein [Pseudomonadota bacterium]MDQ3160066.1 hypothetical protein [Pseudomonadota bacterium]
MNAVVQLPQREPTAAESSFALTVRQAKALAASNLVPKDYRGEDGLANVMVALEIANRIGASPLSVMQSLHVIQGRPSWSASFLIATVNACGRFTPLRFETVGEDPEAKDYRVRAHAKDRDGGEHCIGPWITWQMADGEGWSKKTGSKWLTMPALMFMYRAAAFWTRVYAPELSLGIHTAEEVQDITTGPAPRVDLETLQARLVERGAIEHVASEPAPPADMDPETGPAEVIDTTTGEVKHNLVTFKGVWNALVAADSQGAVIALGAAIGEIPDDDNRNDLEALYDKRLSDLPA